VCPSEEDLRRYLDEELGEADRAAIEAHLQDCPRCFEMLQAMVDEGAEVIAGALRRRLLIPAHLQPPVPDPDPAPADSPGAEAAPKDAPRAIAEGPGSRFHILRSHARGGLGEVLIAHQEELDRTVALKRIRPDKLHEAARRRFLREAALTARLQHPGIVPIYGLGQDDDAPFYTMPLIQGQTLKEAIANYHQRRGKWKKPELRSRLQLLQAFVSICRTMGYAHSRGVIHRDLKPANIILGSFGEVIVLDWGLAKMIGPADASEDKPSVWSVEPIRAGATSDGQLLGTLAYMAPEQAMGLTDSVDQSTDVYGLGSILFEILTGRTPHQGRTTAELRQRISDGATPRVRSIDPWSPAELDAICAKAMAKSRTDRYANATDLADDVERWLADEPVNAYPSSWRARTRSWLNRYPQIIPWLLIFSIFDYIIMAGLIGPHLVRSDLLRTHHAVVLGALSMTLIVLQFPILCGFCYGLISGAMRGEAGRGAEQGVRAGFHIGTAIGKFLMKAVLWLLILKLLLAFLGW
jgi:serine/threonine protein kinase